MCLTVLSLGHELPLSPCDSCSMCYLSSCLKRRFHIEQSITNMLYGCTGQSTRRMLKHTTTRIAAWSPTSFPIAFGQRVTWSPLKLRKRSTYEFEILLSLVFLYHIWINSLKYFCIILFNPGFHCLERNTSWNLLVMPQLRSIAWFIFQV